METSKHIDRERRRTKPKARKSWITVLLNPKTVTSLIAVGRLVTYAVWLVIWLYDLFVKVLRE